MSTNSDNTSHHLLDRIRRVAESRPDRVALEEVERQTSYRRLLAHAAAVARLLDENEVSAGGRVVVMGRRGAAAIATFLACLARNVTYVPIDPQQPAARIDAQVTASGAGHIVVTDPRDRVAGGLTPIRIHDLDALVPACWSPAEPDLAGLAYVMFSSGSSGAPKGIMIGRDNLEAYVHCAIGLYDVHPADRVLQTASLGFDWSVSEIFPTLSAGACLVLRSAHALESPMRLSAELRTRRISVAHLPTAVWRSALSGLTDSAEDLVRELRHVTIGGEAVTAEAVRAWRRSFGDRVRLLNTYGPTECTVEAVAAELAGPEAVDLDQRHRIPLGRPLPGCRIHLMVGGRRAGPHEPGRILLGGWGVGRGYLGDGEATARRFVPDPGGEGTLYDTGDLGCWNDHGELEFFGREDRQVKLAGYRVELEEVELALATCPAVRESAVTLKDADALVAFVVLTPGNSVDVAHEQVSGMVPAYMVPAEIREVAALPRTVNDKVDRRRLAQQAELPGVDAAPPPSTMPVDRASIASSQELSASVAAVWMRVLRLTSLAPGHDFFELGGHSLLAMRLVGQLSRELGMHVELKDLLQAPDLESLSRLLADRRAATNAQEVSTDV